MGKQRAPRYPTDQQASHNHTNNNTNNTSSMRRPPPNPRSQLISQHYPTAAQYYASPNIHSTSNKGSSYNTHTPSSLTESQYNKTLGMSSTSNSSGSTTHQSQSTRGGNLTANKSYISSSSSSSSNSQNQHTNNSKDSSSGGSQKLYFTSPRCELPDAKIFPTSPVKRNSLTNVDDRWNTMSEQAGSHRQDSSVLHVSRRHMTPSVLKAGVLPQVANRVKELHLRLEQAEDMLPEWLDVISAKFQHLEHLVLTRDNHNNNNAKDDEGPTAQPSRLRRLYILYRLPHLVSIDNVPVTKSERRLARPDDPNGHRVVSKEEWFHLGGTENKEINQQHTSGKKTKDGPSSPRHDKKNKHEDTTTKPQQNGKTASKRKSPDRKNKQQQQQQQQPRKSPKAKRKKADLVVDEMRDFVDGLEILERVDDDDDDEHDLADDDRLSSLADMISESGEGYELDLDLADAIQRITTTAPNNNNNNNNQGNNNQSNSNTKKADRSASPPPTSGARIWEEKGNKSKHNNKQKHKSGGSPQKQASSPTKKAHGKPPSSPTKKASSKPQSPRKASKDTKNASNNKDSNGNTSSSNNHNKAILPLPTSSQTINSIVGRELVDPATVDFLEDDSTVTSAYGYGHWSGACFAPFQVCTSQPRKKKNSLSARTKLQQSVVQKASSNANIASVVAANIVHGAGRKFQQPHRLTAGKQQQQQQQSATTMTALPLPSALKKPTIGAAAADPPPHTPSTNGDAPATDQLKLSPQPSKSHKYSTMVDESNQRQELKQRKKLFRDSSSSHGGSTAPSRRSHKYSKLLVQVNDRTGGNSSSCSEDSSKERMRLITTGKISSTGHHQSAAAPTAGDPGGAKQPRLRVNTMLVEKQHLQHHQAPPQQQQQQPKPSPANNNKAKQSQSQQQQTSQQPRPQQQPQHLYKVQIPQKQAQVAPHPQQVKKHSLPPLEDDEVGTMTGVSINVVKDANSGMSVATIPSVLQRQAKRYDMEQAQKGKVQLISQPQVPPQQQPQTQTQPTPQPKPASEVGSLAARRNLTGVTIDVPPPVQNEQPTEPPLNKTKPKQQNPKPSQTKSEKVEAKDTTTTKGEKPNKKVMQRQESQHSSSDSKSSSQQRSAASRKKKKSDDVAAEKPNHKKSPAPAPAPPPPSRKQKVEDKKSMDSAEGPTDPEIVDMVLSKLGRHFLTPPGIPTVVAKQDRESSRGQDVVMQKLMQIETKTAAQTTSPEKDLQFPRLTPTSDKTSKKSAGGQNLQMRLSSVRSTEDVQRQSYSAPPEGNARKSEDQGNTKNLTKSKTKSQQQTREKKTSPSTSDEDDSTTFKNRAKAKFLEKAIKQRLEATDTAAIEAAVSSASGPDPASSRSGSRSDGSSSQEDSGARSKENFHELETRLDNLIHNTKGPAAALKPTTAIPQSPPETKQMSAADKKLMAETVSKLDENLRTILELQQSSPERRISPDRRISPERRISPTERRGMRRTSGEQQRASRLSLADERVLSTADERRLSTPDFRRRHHVTLNTPDEKDASPLERLETTMAGLFASIMSQMSPSKRILASPDVSNHGKSIIAKKEKKRDTFFSKETKKTLDAMQTQDEDSTLFVVEIEEKEVPESLTNDFHFPPPMAKSRAGIQAPSVVHLIDPSVQSSVTVFRAAQVQNLDTLSVSPLPPSTQGDFEQKTMLSANHIPPTDRGRQPTIQEIAAAAKQVVQDAGLDHQSLLETSSLAIISDTPSVQNPAVHDTSPADRIHNDVEVIRDSVQGNISGERLHDIEIVHDSSQQNMHHMDPVDLVQSVVAVHDSTSHTSVRHIVSVERVHDMTHVLEEAKDPTIIDLTDKSSTAMFPPAEANSSGGWKAKADDPTVINLVDVPSMRTDKPTSENEGHLKLEKTQPGASIGEQPQKPPHEIQVQHPPQEPSEARLQQPSKPPSEIQLQQQSQEPPPETSVKQQPEDKPLEKPSDLFLPPLTHVAKPVKSPETTQVDTGGKGKPTDISQQGSKLGMVVNLPTVFENEAPAPAMQEVDGQCVAAAAAGAAAGAEASSDSFPQPASDQTATAETECPSDFIPTNKTVVGGLNASNAPKSRIVPPHEITTPAVNPILAILQSPIREDSSYQRRVAGSDKSMNFPSEVVVQNEGESTKTTKEPALLAELLVAGPKKSTLSMMSRREAFWQKHQSMTPNSGRLPRESTARANNEETRRDSPPSPKAAKPTLPREIIALLEESEASTSAEAMALLPKEIVMRIEQTLSDAGYHEQLSPGSGPRGEILGSMIDDHYSPQQSAGDPLSIPDDLRLMLEEFDNDRAAGSAAARPRDVHSPAFTQASLSLPREVVAMPIAHSFTGEFPTSASEEMSWYLSSRPREQFQQELSQYLSRTPSAEGFPRGLTSFDGLPEELLLAKQHILACSYEMEFPEPEGPDLEDGRSRAPSHRSTSFDRASDLPSSLPSKIAVNQSDPQSRPVSAARSPSLPSKIAVNQQAQHQPQHEYSSRPPSLPSKIGVDPPAPRSPQSLSRPPSYPSKVPTSQQTSQSQQHQSPTRPPSLPSKVALPAPQQQSHQSEQDSGVPTSVPSKIAVNNQNNANNVVGSDSDKNRDESLQFRPPSLPSKVVVNKGDGGGSSATSSSPNRTKLPASKSLSSPFPLQFRARLVKSLKVSMQQKSAAAAAAAAADTTTAAAKAESTTKAPGGRVISGGGSSSQAETPSSASKLPLQITVDNNNHKNGATNINGKGGIIGTISNPASPSARFLKPVSSPLLRNRSKKVAALARSNGELPPHNPSSERRSISSISPRSEKMNRTISRWKQQRNARANSIIDDEEEDEDDEEEEEAQNTTDHAVSYSE